MNDYKDDFICKIESPSPEWVTFEIKTTMKDKFGANTTPKGSGASEAQKDYLKNIRDHSKESTESMRFGRNDFNLNKEQFDLLNSISKGMSKNNIVGYKLTAVVDDKFNVGGNNKYLFFYYLEGLDKWVELIEY
nr:hypothetical protein [Providencia stuartii]